MARNPLETAVDGVAAVAGVIIVGGVLLVGLVIVGLASFEAPLGDDDGLWTDGKAAPDDYELTDLVCDADNLPVRTRLDVAGTLTNLTEEGRSFIVDVDVLAAGSVEASTRIELPLLKVKEERHWSAGGLTLPMPVDTSTVTCRYDVLLASDD